MMQKIINLIFMMCCFDISLYAASAASPKSEEEEEKEFDEKFNAALVQEEQKYQRDLSRVDKTIDKLNNLKAFLIETQKKPFDRNQAINDITFYVEILEHAYNDLRDSARRKFLKKHLMRSDEYFKGYKDQLAIINQAKGDKKQVTQITYRLINQLIATDIDHVIAIFGAMRPKDYSELAKDPKKDKKSAKQVRFQE